MGFRINTNIGAMNAHRNATMNNLQLDKSLNRLSSGLRINRAADDSAGLAIADKLSAQSQGLGQAMRNANDAIGLVQTADGALQEYTKIAQRIRTLAVQAANDTQDSGSRSYIQTEVNRLISSASFINTQTKFNGKTLFTGGSFTFHVGAYTKEITKTKIDSMTASNVLGAAGVSTQSAAEGTISAMDSALKKIDTLRAKLGAAQNQLESTVRNNSTAQVNVAAAESQIRDVDFAAESANFNKRNILAQSGSYAMSQANAVQQNVLRLLQ
ncbi:Flagellin [hydrothermal vent metagenome]|uniref:Flagellin n=1 Tax=hydrothermal vent metagenome TaxID=652676 RepID=A0A1W1BM33_9ZZZZ